MAPKRGRRLDGFDETVLWPYARGMATGDVEARFLSVYGTRVSRQTVSDIVEKVEALFCFT